MKKYYAFGAVFLCSTLALAACNHSTQRHDPTTSTQVDSQHIGVADPAHTAENALDWNGQYLGIFPCADCPGLKTVLTLNLDKTYSLEESYLERNVKPTLVKGSFHFDDKNSSIIILDGEANQRLFFIGEGFAEARAIDGTEMDGPLKSSYKLKKIN